MLRAAELDPSPENLQRLGMAYLRSQTGGVAHIHFYGRRWFSRTHGNTYHTVTVVVDDQEVAQSAISYGYGDQYVQTGMELINALVASDQIDAPAFMPGERPYRYEERTGVRVQYEAQDVRRRRDL